MLVPVTVAWADHMLVYEWRWRKFPQWRDDEGLEPVNEPDRYMSSWSEDCSGNRTKLILIS